MPRTQEFDSQIRTILVKHGRLACDVAGFVGNFAFSE